MMVAVVTTHVKSRRRKKTKQTKRNLKKRNKMNTETFKTRLEEVRSNLIATRAEKGKALEQLLERNLIQDLKEALRNNLSLLLQTEEKYLELERQYKVLIQCGKHQEKDKITLVKSKTSLSNNLNNPD